MVNITAFAIANMLFAAIATAFAFCAGNGIAGACIVICIMSATSALVLASGKKA